MNELDLLRERKKREHRKGDGRTVCERCGVSPALFQAAFRKKEVEDLSDREMFVIRTYIEILDKRKEEREKLRDTIAVPPASE